MVDCKENCKCNLGVKGLKHEMLFIQVSKKNIMDIIKKLMVQIDKADSQSESL